MVMWLRWWEGWCQDRYMRCFGAWMAGLTSFCFEVGGRADGISSTHIETERVMTGRHESCAVVCMLYVCMYLCVYMDTVGGMRRAREEGGMEEEEKDEVGGEG